MTSKLVVNEIAADTGISTITVGDNMSGVTFKTGTSNLHNVGIEIAGINVLGADTPIGAGATIYNSGDVIVGGAVTATAFSGSGASLTNLPAGNLTGTVADARISTLTASKLSGALPAISGASLTNLPAQATIANNADNRVITGGSGVNLNGEANLTFNGSNLQFNTTANGNAVILKSTGNHYTKLSFDSNNTSAGGELAYIDFSWDGDKVADIFAEAGSDTTNKDDGHLVFRTSPQQGNIAERLRIKSDGGILQTKTGGNANYTISRNESVGTTNQVIGVIDFASNTAHTVQARLMGKTRGTSNVGGDLVVETRADGGSLDERFRITGEGKIGINNDNPIHAVHIKSVMASSPSYIHMTSTGSNVNGGGGGIAFDTSAANTNEGLFIATIAGIRNTAGDGSNDLVFSTSKMGVNGGAPTEKMRITSEGDIYGPVGGRKNWFDNGSFDCTYGGRKNNVSMDYGNHHAYGWVTDRFQSRNSVQWSRSSTVPAGKGFSYSTQTNGAGGALVQCVELPDYGDMGVFVPNSYWCVSFWSTAACNQGGQAFSYDLGSTKTTIPIVHPSSGGAYQTTGETASGTSTGTFSRYYMVFQMPSSIISTASSAYWQWGFSAAGYATGFQLERVPTSTSKPTPYEHVPPSVTIARCRRYAYRKYNSRHVTGWKRHDTGVHWEAKHPVLPTHMPSGSNQSADPYGIHLHTAGQLTNFQGNWQNPAVTSLSRYGFCPADGSFIVNGQSNYSGTHVVIPSWEGFEYEVGHGHF